MTTRTMAELIEATGLEVLTELDKQLEIPLVAGKQRQGDVLIRPAKVQATTPVPATGTAVVRGENGVAGQRVEQGGFARIGQPDDSNGKCHVAPAYSG